MKGRRPVRTVGLMVCFLLLAALTGPVEAYAQQDSGEFQVHPAAADTNRPPEIKSIGTLQFYQLDTLRIHLDTLVTDDHTPEDSIRWEVEVLDSRYLDNPNSQNDQHLKVEVDRRDRILMFTTTPFFRANNIPVRLIARDTGGLSDSENFRLTVLSVEGVPGKVYELKQNYPNPFRSSTTIEFWIPVRARVVLNVYDLLGRQVARLVDRHDMPHGVHTVEWRPGNLASGFYIIRLEAAGVDESRFAKSLEMTLIR